MEWRKINNEHYSISECGIIRNDLTNRLLKKVCDSKGYQKCSLYNNGKYKGYLAHRLVAIYFLSPPLIGQTQVNHKDGNPLNNHYTNLEWCTPKQNTDHAVITGLFPRGETHHFSRIKDYEIIEIREKYSTGNYRQHQLATLYKVNQSEISRYVNFKRRGGKCA